MRCLEKDCEKILVIPENFGGGYYCIYFEDFVDEFLDKECYYKECEKYDAS